MKLQRTSLFFLCVVLIGLISLAGVWLFRSSEPELRHQARLAYENHQWPDSFNLAGKRLREDRQDRAARLIMARSAARLGRDAVALELYGQNKENQANPEDLYLVGLILMRQGRIQTGEELVKQALKVDPDYVEPLKFLSDFYFRNNQKFKALALNDQWFQSNRLDPDALLMRGQIFDSLAEPKSAVEAFSSLLKIKKTTKEPAFNRDYVIKMTARNLLRDQRPELAKAILLNSQYATLMDQETHWLLSRAYLQSGDVALAQDSLQKYKDAIEQGAPRVDFEEPAPFTGAESCRPCHETNYEDQQNSRHALTFHLGNTTENMPWNDFQKSDPHIPGLHAGFDTELDQNQRKWRTKSDNPEIQSLVQFIMGSGRHAITPILKDENDQFLESRWTYYASINDWDLTPGQLLMPSDKSHYVGVPQTPDMLRICLECHTTNASAVIKQQGIERLDRGIGCERCHGPGGNHLAAMKLNFPDKSIGRFRRNSVGTRPQALQLCAECHGTQGRDIIQKGDAAVVRFQATTLTFSQCYKMTEGTGEFDCLTCHSPHQNAESDLTFYDAKCLKCHGQAEPENLDAPKLQSANKICPVNAVKDCTSCHMPKIDSVQPHAKFTDHQIRIRKELK